MKGMLLNADTGDLEVSGGTIAIGESTAQVTELVICANRGEIKEFPLVGVEIDRMRNGCIDRLWCATAKTMLQGCDLPIEQVRYENGILTIE